MANYFMSVTSTDAGSALVDPDHVGSASTAGDKIELRFDQTCTQRQVLNAMNSVFRRWIEMNGLNGAGANLPPVR